MKKLLVLIALCLLVSPAFSADKVPVLIVDSGSDFAHEFLKNSADASLSELNGVKDKDDDGNGYVDDVYGWNFVDNNPTLVNLDNTPPEYDKVMKFLDIIGKLQASGINSLTEDELAFARKYYNDQQFMAWVGFTGGWAHGTHVAGIVANGNENVKLKAITHIPSGQAPMAAIKEMIERVSFLLATTTRSRTAALPGADTVKGIEDNALYPQIVAYFKKMGEDSAKESEAKAKYMGTLDPKVINCSFGTDNPQLLKMFKGQMTQWGYQNPSDKDVQDMVNLFVKEVSLPQAKALFKYVPGALLVIAAGNSSENNDGIQVSPNNVDYTNKIIVAATNDDEKMADFTCYGKETVDIAVPGVNILSSYPNGKMGKMSGTSQAAPLVAKYASMILAENPNLTPQEVKKILMGTVDKKSWLKGKVVSEGVVNINRALAVAKGMKTNGLELDYAIVVANDEIPNIKPETRSVFFNLDIKSEEEKALYNSAIF